MTDQMHDGKCNEMLVREETIHGRGPAEAVYIPNLLRSLQFLRLVIFFFLDYYWLLREQLFPSLLPFRITILTLTDRPLMGKTHGVRRSNSAMELMCCIKGGIRGGPQGSGGGPGSNPQTQDQLGLGERGGRVLSGLVLSLFIYLLILLFVYLF